MTILTNVLIAGMSVLAGVLSARALGPTGRGELAAIQSWTLFLAPLAMLGVPEAVTYFAAREPDRIGSWLTTGVLVVFAAIIPVGLLGVACVPSLLGAQRPEVARAGAEYLAVIPALCAVGVLIAPLRGRNDLVAWNVFRSVQAALWSAVLGVSVLLAIRDPGAIARSHVIALSAIVVPMSCVVRMRIPGSFHLCPSLVSPLLRYSLSTLIAALPITLSQRMAELFMTRFSSPEALGLYVVAVAWSRAPSLLLGALPAVVLPRIAQARALADQANEIMCVMRLGGVLSFLLGLSTVGVASIGVPILYGREYESAIPPAMILSLAAALVGFNQVMEAGALGLGKPHLVLIGESIGAGVMALLLTILLGPFGVAGAAMAIVLSTTVVTVVMMRLISRELGVGVLQIVGARCALSSDPYGVFRHVTRFRRQK